MIRRDLFSVKVRSSCTLDGTYWCHDRIFRSLESARRYRANLTPTGGYWLESKIVHPCQDVVNVYVASGMAIA
jgi:hypothetical protein